MITGAAMEVMARNAANIGNLDYRLNHSDLLVMKCVVEGMMMQKLVKSRFGVIGFGFEMVNEVRR